jgi:hypothetical protein
MISEAWKAFLAGLSVQASLDDGLRSEKRKGLKPQWSQPHKRVISFFVKKEAFFQNLSLRLGSFPQTSPLTPGAHPVRVLNHVRFVPDKPVI